MQVGKKVIQMQNPTSENKELMKRNNLNPDRWFVIWEDKHTLEVISKRTRQRRVLKKVITNE